MLIGHCMEARALKTGYDNRVIIDGVNVSIPDGKISVILGANGCGKSTLLKTFCRLNRIFAGEILLDGKQTADLAPKEFACTVGLMPQSPLVPEGITVYDLVSRGRFPYRKFMKGLGTEDFQAVKDALEMMEIADMADRPVDELSGGQRQRAAIAGSLIMKPEFVVADEPVSMLDASIRTGIIRLMLKERDEKGVAYLFITHDLSLAWLISDKIAIMYLGKIMEIGTADEIVNNPKHPYSKALLGIMPVPGKVLTGKRKILEGETPNAGVEIKGCKFCGRCPEVMPKCHEIEPENIEISPGHFVMCHKYSGQASEKTE